MHKHAAYRRISEVFVSKSISEPMTERHQSENRKVQADKEFEAGRMSGPKYEQEIARANKAGKKGRR